MNQHRDPGRRRIGKGLASIFVIIAGLALVIFVGFNVYYLVRGK